ncbi:exocyst complex component Sec3-domain-containing protein [Dissophora ornata]|nr:exocyst complex component Sec3-domain-containing protein [Dissophora ornata]
MLTYIKIYEEEKSAKDAKIIPMGKKGGSVERTKMLSKPRYLCMTVKANGKVRLHKVRKTSATSFHIGRTWHLDEIKSIENVDAKRWTVVINRPYTWVSDTSELKTDFMMMLLKVLRSNLKKLPTLINIDEPALATQFTVSREAASAPAPRSHRAAPIPDGNSATSTTAGSFVQDFENRLSIQKERMKRTAIPSTSSLGSTIVAGGATSPVSERNGAKFIEENEPLDEVALMNLEELLYDMDLASSEDGVALETRLMKELNALETSNIYSIIESDDRIKDVMSELDKGIEELDDMDSWLSMYCLELDSMGDDIRQIESQNRGLQVQTSNQASLLRELENLLISITIPDRVMESLKKETLERESGIHKLENAAAEIQDVLLAKYDVDVAEMSAVRGRMDLYGFHCSNFAGRLADFLKNKIQTQTDQFLNDKQRTQGKGYIVMFGYEPIEKYFIAYRGLILWLREMDSRRFTDLQMIFVNNLNRLYRKEIKEFFNVLTTHHVAKLEKPDDSEFVFGSTYHGGLIARGGSALRDSLSSPSDLTGRISWRRRSTREMSDHPSSSANRNGVLNGSSRRIDVNPEEKLAVDEAFSQALSIVTSVAAREQNYLSDLFTLTKMMSMRMFIDDPPPFSLQELDTKRKSTLDLKSSKRLAQLMGIMFDGLSVELNNLAENGVKNENVQCVGMLISVERMQKEFVDSDQVFLTTMLTQLHAKLAGMFDKYVEEQLKFIEEARHKTKRKGVLPFMRIFPRFAERMETLLDGNNDIEARKMITAAYDKLVRMMFESTEAVAKETVDFDDKEQGSHVVNIENMHHFYSELRQRKIQNLENYMKYAKSSYESHLETYVRSVVRRSLLKLLDFFDGVEGLVKTKASEDVAFHLTYNKQAVKKVVSQYPASMVRKDISHLYKKVEKHFSSEEEEGLLQVAWRGIQEEFIRQHERFSRLIRECYPDAGVQMEFSMQELLGFFSDIAKNHH